jgi:hypothetical protein
VSRFLHDFGSTEPKPDQPSLGVNSNNEAFMHFPLTHKVQTDMIVDDEATTVSQDHQDSPPISIISQNKEPTREPTKEPNKENI